MAQMSGSIFQPLTKRMVPSMAANPTPTPTISTVVSRFSCARTKFAGAAAAGSFQVGLPGAQTPPVCTVVSSGLRAGSLGLGSRLFASVRRSGRGASCISFSSQSPPPPSHPPSPFPGPSPGEHNRVGRSCNMCIRLVEDTRRPMPTPYAHTNLPPATCHQLPPSITLVARTSCGATVAGATACGCCSNSLLMATRKASPGPPASLTSSRAVITRNQHSRLMRLPRAPSWGGR